MGRSLLCLLIAVTPGLAAAAGVAGFPGDVVPYPVDGKLVTGGYEHYVSPPISSPAEDVFMYQFAQEPDDPNFTSDPGFDNLAGFPALPKGQPLGFQVTTNLLYWDGNGPVSFAPALPTAKITLSLGSGSLQIKGDSVTGDLDTIQVSNIATGRLHTHLGATIGSSSPEGIYMFGMTINMPGLIDSDPFAIMYNDLQTLLAPGSSPDDYAKAVQIGQTAAEWTEDHPAVLLPWIPGDANHDGFVDGADYTSWADHFLLTGQTWGNGDFSGDGVVDGADYTIWADHFSPALAPSLLTAAAVPEPATLVLAFLAVAALAFTRRSCLRRPTDRMH